MFSHWQPFALLLALVAIDFVSGMTRGIIHEGYISSKVRVGLVHKGTYVVALLLSWILEQIALYADLPLAMIGTMVSMVYVWIVISETGSILENIVAINPDLADNAFLSIFAKREESTSNRNIGSTDDLEESHAEGD